MNEVYPSKIMIYTSNDKSITIVSNDLASVTFILVVGLVVVIVNIDDIISSFLNDHGDVSLVFDVSTLIYFGDSQESFIHFPFIVYN